jgi:isoprenylcysteine carboxyl methyltransferase (ICMT) family protein YpbQ
VAAVVLVHTLWVLQALVELLLEILTQLLQRTQVLEVVVLLTAMVILLLELQALSSLGTNFNRGFL